MMQRQSNWLRDWLSNWLQTLLGAVRACCLCRCRPPGSSFWSLPEIVRNAGYTCRASQVTTQDGFILTIFRVGSHSKDENKSRRRPVVLLWHGLLDSAYTWVLPGKRGLLFSLVDEGYDVFLANNRGTTYSKRHAFLNPQTDEPYWDFTYDEMADFDVPAVISSCLQISGADTLQYVGHSEGTTQFFAAVSAGSLRKHDSDLLARIDSFVGLAPVASVTHMAGIFRILATFHIDRLTWACLPGHGEFLGAPSSYTRRALGALVSIAPAFLGQILWLLTGKGQPLAFSKDPRKLAEFGEHEPGGTSALNMVHWAQGVRAPTKSPFRRFDYGPTRNKQRYGGRPTPPEYPLSEMWPRQTVLPTLLVSGTADELATPQGVAWLFKQLGGASESLMPRQPKLRRDSNAGLSGSRVGSRPRVGSPCEDTTARVRL